MIIVWKTDTTMSVIKQMPSRPDSLLNVTFLLSADKVSRMWSNICHEKAQL